MSLKGGSEHAPYPNWKIIDNFTNRTSTVSMILIQPVIHHYELLWVTEPYSG